MHHVTSIRIALLFAFVALVGLAFVGLGPAATAAPPTLTAADLASFHISDPVDVTVLADKDLPTAAFSRAKAIAAARAEVGEKLPQTVVLHARAPRFLDEPDRSVWVVLFAGGVVPFDGPDGGAGVSSNGRITGVIIDDTTGEFLSGFIR